MNVSTKWLQQFLFSKNSSTIPPTTQVEKNFKAKTVLIIIMVCKACGVYPVIHVPKFLIYTRSRNVIRVQTHKRFVRFKIFNMRHLLIRLKISCSQKKTHRTCLESAWTSHAHADKIKMHILSRQARVTDCPLNTLSPSLSSVTLIVNICNCMVMIRDTFQQGLVSKTSIQNDELKRNNINPDSLNTPLKSASNDKYRVTVYTNLFETELDANNFLKDEDKLKTVEPF